MSNGEKKGRGCFFYGCVFSLGLAGLFAASMVALFFYGSRSLSPYPEKFLTLVDSDDYAGAYAMVAADWKKQSTLDEFTAFEKSMKDALGTCTSKTMTGVSVNTNNGVTTGRLNYSANFTKGPATLTFNMIKENDEWKILGVTYNSDLLKKKAEEKKPEEEK